MHGLKPSILSMGWVWKLPNSFLVRLELRRTLRLLYMYFWLAVNHVRGLYMSVLLIFDRFYRKRTKNRKI